MSTPHASAFEEFISIVARLRSPDGCPWDRKQTPASLRADLIGEAYECIAAIDARDDGNLEEELGDVLLLLALICRIKEEEGVFDIAKVLRGISAKLIRRHPHVFGDETRSSVEDVLVRWDQIKKEEKGAMADPSALSGVPASLPPLEKAVAIQKKASKVGFDWSEPGPVWEKLAEEIGETREAVASADPGAVEREIGDMLFTVANLARLLGVDAPLALRGTNDRFSGRFRQVEGKLSAMGRTPKEAGLQLMDRLWDEVKAEERANRSHGDPVPAEGQPGSSK